MEKTIMYRLIKVGLLSLLWTFTLSVFGSDSQAITHCNEIEQQKVQTGKLVNIRAPTPLRSVTVIAKLTALKTVTDGNGVFSLLNINEGTT